MCGPIWHAFVSIILLKDSSDKAVLYLSLIILNREDNTVNRHWKISSEFKFIR